MSVDEFISSRSEPSRSTILELRAQLEALGCTADYKTIYVSFNLADSVVAAAYPHPDGVELALALEDDLTDNRLQDASHLTWRSLPVLVELSSRTDVDAVADLLIKAVNRVRSEDHDVNLSNEELVRRRQRRLPS